MILDFLKKSFAICLAGLSSQISIGKSFNPSEFSTEPFAQAYLNLELARNFPLANSQDAFLSGSIQPVFSYRHSLNQSWILGIGGQYKVFNRTDPELNRETVLWSAFHETLHIVRLQHPTYFLVGPKLFYFMPASSGKLPLRRDESLQVEFGVGLSITFGHFVKQNFITFRVDRWRGVTTNRLHGSEVALGINMPIQTNNKD